MQNYNGIEKLLHDIVLSKKIINRSLFEFEKIIYLKNKKIKNQEHIFITGLPRSGTTSLLNFIYSSNDYASLTYKNMPFILSPNFSKFFNKKEISKKERLHRDGVTFDINSPEALDEFFFDNNEDFIKKELLNYLELILFSYSKDKYLSKNNLNYKRIDLITEILPKSKFLIIIRDPLQHSYSLLNQHVHFCKLQKENDFIKRYMNYLGHNEFGLDHKSWSNPINFNDFNDLNYWIEQWDLFYQNILKKYFNHKNCHFILYEQLTNIDYIKKMLKKINIIDSSNLNLNYFKNFNKSVIESNFDTINNQNAQQTYINFKNKSFLDIGFKT
tara:strand:- start:173 stop:1159 length:987 start_codon:yes stop_codon:yes gene_type:complete